MQTSLSRFILQDSAHETRPVGEDHGKPGGT